jgi:hypothetical protein
MRQQTSQMRQTDKKPTVWSAVLVPLGIVAVMTPAILLAAGGSGQGFDAVVNSIESRYHAHATRIPFMSLISGIAGLSTHGGVRGLHVAEFEHFRGDGDRPVDGAEFNALIEKHVGEGWQRIIRETSRDGGEQSLIYVRAEGDHLGMLVVDLDSHELDVVQMSMNPDQLMHEVSKHQHEHGQGHDADASEDDKHDDADSE